MVLGPAQITSEWGGWVVRVALVGVALVWIIRILRRRERSLARLEENAPEHALAGREVAPMASSLQRYRWAAAIPAIVAAVVALSVFRLPALLASAIGAVVIAIGLQLEALRYERRCEKLEAGLASTVDLVVAALLAGTSISQALSTAAARSRQPLRGWFDEILERLGLGESAPHLFSELAERVPLEGYRLFAIALSTSWESGGRYGEALARASRAIRDRLALRRRIRSQSIETRFSMFGVLGLSWILFALAMSSEPERMQNFARSELGSFLLAGSLLLQALGIQWIDRLTREEL